MTWNNLATPKIQRLHRWSLGMDMKTHLTFSWICYYVSMLGIKLNHVSKRQMVYIHDRRNCIQDLTVDIGNSFTGDTMSWHSSFSLGINKLKIWSAVKASRAFKEQIMFAILSLWIHIQRHMIFAKAFRWYSQKASRVKHAYYDIIKSHQGSWRS